MSLRLRDLQIDVAASGYDDAVAFWARALDATAVAVDQTYTFLDDARAPLGVHLQRLGEGGAAEAGAYHLDLEAGDVATEVTRLVGLGATVDDDGPCAVLRDPAGLAFCVCRGHGRPERVRVEPTSAARLHVVVVDVPSAVVDRTAAFWADALSGRASAVGPAFPAYRQIEGIEGPGGPVAMLVQDTGAEGPTRLHIDLHVPTPAERDTEVARLVSLGAGQVGGHGHWLVLQDPTGHTFCVVPDRKA